MRRHSPHAWVCSKQFHWNWTEMCVPCHASVCITKWVWEKERKQNNTVIGYTPNQILSYYLMVARGSRSQYHVVATAVPKWVRTCNYYTLITINLEECCIDSLEYQQNTNTNQPCRQLKLRRTLEQLKADAGRASRLQMIQEKLDKKAVVGAANTKEKIDVSCAYILAILSPFYVVQSWAFQCVCVCFCCRKTTEANQRISQVHSNYRAGRIERHRWSIARLR